MMSTLISIDYNDNLEVLIGFWAASCINSQFLLNEGTHFEFMWLVSSS